MSRTVPAALLTALDGDEIEVFYAVDLDFDSGNMRLWTGYGNKTINSQTYTGTGDLLTIDGLEEVSDLSARGTTLTLNGLDSTIVSYALTEEYQGRLVTIYWGVGSNTVEIFRGYMDKMTIQDAGETSTISLTVESRLIALERANVRRYTRESHSAVRLRKWLDDGNSGTPAADTFFDWTTQLQDKQIVWGREVKDGEA
jgi:hypothetical protein